MIIVTGSAGFIGSCLVSKLNNKGIKDIVLVDDFSDEIKNRNIRNKSYLEKVDRKVFFEWMKQNHSNVEFVFHIGARTDTTEFNMAIFDELNLFRATLLLPDYDQAGIDLAEQAGFTLEVRMRQADYRNGQCWNRLIYGLLRPEYEKRQPAEVAA